MEFLQKNTKVKSIVASVITVLAFITLIMLTTLLTIPQANKINLTLVYTTILMLCLLLWTGIINIRVYNDYMSKNGWLLTDGIMSICLSVLLLISGVLFGVLQLDKAMTGTLVASSDIRIFLTAFLSILVVWKVFIMIKAIKHKHFNWWLELTKICLWFALAIVILVSMFSTNLNIFFWIISIIAWMITIIESFYILFSYVIKTPNYLETEAVLKAYEIKQAEIEKQELRKMLREDLPDRPNIQNKLKQLQNIKDSGLITEQEYKLKKEEILKKL